MTDDSRPADPASFDFAIVGAGIVGATIAYQLARHARVLILEAEAAPGYHTTGRSAALYEPSYGPTAVRALTRASRTFFDAPPAGFASNPLLTPRGCLFVGPAEAQTEARDRLKTLAAEGGEVRWVEPAEALAMVPVLRPEASAVAVFDTNAFDIDVDSLLQGFLRGARDAGAALQTRARVARLDRAGSGWQIATDDGRQFAARVVINAAGAWADPVAELAGAAPLKVEPRRRSAFLFRPPEGMDVRAWPAVIALDESWYFKPDAGQLLGTPANADPVPPHDVMPEEIDVATGIYRIESATTLEIRRPTHTWAGLRCFAPDGEPMLGYDPAVPGFFWAAGLGGFGVQSSPAVGMLCAALLRDAPLPEALVAAGVDPAALSPQRTTG
ncbi:MAG: FAD-binding oxidoreductase [Burkholderiaceae bacterium]